jgi:transcription termination/antitermination protein NusG
MSEETKWYVLRVLSGKERKIKEYIENEVTRSGWAEIIKQVMIPTEKVYHIKNGKKIIKERNFFPGYVLLEADEHRIHGDMLQTIRNISGVINFLGGTKPQALRKLEVNRILGKVDEMAEAGLKINEPYLVGETVKITDGPFNDFNGVVEEVNEEKKKLKVTVKIFGRKTPVELNYNQVAKNN